jgi:hypothetical protein
MVDYRILGPLEVSADGRVIETCCRKTSAASRLWAAFPPPGSFYCSAPQPSGRQRGTRGSRPVRWSAGHGIVLPIRGRNSGLIGSLAGPVMCEAGVN